MTKEQRTAALAWLTLNAEPGRTLKNSEQKKWEERLDRYIKSWQKEGAAPMGPLDLASLATIQAHVRIQYDQAKVRRHNAGRGVARQDTLDVQERRNRKYGLSLRALASSLPSPNKPDTLPSQDRDLKPTTPHPNNPTLYPSLDTEDDGVEPPPYPQPTEPQSWQDKPNQHGPVGPTVTSDVFGPPWSPDPRPLMNPLIRIDHATPHTPVLVHWDHPSTWTQGPDGTRLHAPERREERPHPTKSNRSPCRMIPGRAGPLGQEPLTDYYDKKPPRDQKTKTRPASPPGSPHRPAPKPEPRPSTSGQTRMEAARGPSRHPTYYPDTLTPIMADLLIRTDNTRSREKATQEDHLDPLEERCSSDEERRNDDTADTLEWNPGHLDLSGSFTGLRLPPQDLSASCPHLGRPGNDPEPFHLPPPPPFPHYHSAKKPEPMYPLIDSSHGPAVYTPWTHRDLKGLMDDLPPIKDGAGKWIRTFERKTTADRLTVGDVRAVLMQGAGPRTVRDVDAVAGTTRQPDNSPFDPFRPGWWDSLRDLYPTQNSGACMSGLTRKRGETAGEYLTRANDVWRDGFGTHPGANEATEAVFRTAIVNGLSPKTRESLDAVIGLGEMDRRTWEQAIVHHVTREVKKETEDDKEELELKRRLLRMDVKTATQNLNRDKKDNNKEQPSEIMALAENPQPTPYAPPQTNNPPQHQPQPNYPPQAHFYPNNPPQHQPQANHSSQAHFYPNNPPQHQPQAYHSSQAQFYPDTPSQKQYHPAPSQPWRPTHPRPTRNYDEYPQPSRGGSRGNARLHPTSNACFRCHQYGHWADRCPNRGPLAPQDARLNGYAGYGWPRPQNPGAPMYPAWTENDHRDGPRQY